MQDNSEPYLTRQEAVRVIREVTGIPVTDSRIDKAAMRGQGPKPIAQYGRRFLYRKTDVIEWALSLVKPAGEAA